MSYKMEYKAEAVYTEADFIGFTKTYVERDDKLRSMEKVTKYCTLGSGVVLVIAGLVNFGLAIAAGALGIRTAAAYAAMIIFGVVLVKLPVDDLSGKREWKRYEGQGATIGFEFYPDHYDQTRQSQPTRREYSAVKALCEDGDRFYLFVSDQSADIVRKDSFKLGTAEDFRLFIVQRTGLEFPDKSKE